MLFSLAMAGALAGVPAVTVKSPAQRRIGSITLRSCEPASTYYCGALERRLDPSGKIAGRIGIGFTWLRHGDPGAAPASTIVAAEGGPGYPSGASRASYRTLFGTLLRSHDLLLMDDRGTGRSGAIDCEPLQSRPVTMLSDVARCGAALGVTSDLYGSAFAADDLDALLSALAIPKVDLYGDSYGTFFVQVFAARHPQRVRSLTLDGAYPAVDDDPWYPSYAPTIRHAFTIVCERSRECRARPGTTLSRIGELLRVVRRARAPIAPAQLAFVMDSAGLDPLAYRDLDAAAGAYLAGDTVPLQRLVREAYVYEERNAGTAVDHSQGLFAAASCQDNPEVYDMRAAPRSRERQWKRILNAKISSDPQLFDPFTIPEFLAMPPDFSYVPLCQSWPVALEYPAGHAVPHAARMPRVPALVLTGELDTITTPAEGDAAAALFPGAHRVIVANSGHVTAVGDTHG
ncbi:MAG: alpha/beta hydrolase, partial [Candidatus Eremiobacteraeota bacterium]|nr:alpha/beta hydrolase [Candidatus Eremiobacteraeota bacterium]